MKKTTFVVQIEVSRDVMLQYWGEPCEVKDKDCPACKAWERWHNTGRIVITTTEQKTLDLLNSI